MDHRKVLDKLFRPRSVAVVGASEDTEKLSGQPLRNLLKVGFSGDVYAINPRVESVSGLQSYGSLSQIPNPTDVAIICLPGNPAVEAAEECLRIGIPVAIVASSGYAEIGTREGRELQERLTRVGENGTRIVGPNCNGIYNALDGVSIGYNVTHGMVLKPGPVAVISHSGALFSSIVTLGEEMGNGLGYSYFVSAGNEADLSLLDYMEYVIDDGSTEVVALILDGVRDVARFRSLCRSALERNKRVVVLKIGQSETGVRATMAHSSRLAGSVRGYQALFEECGAIQAHTVESLVGICAVTSKYRVRRSRCAVGLSTSGAGCALMADTAQRYGVRFPPLSPVAVERMERQQGFGTPMNPFDVGASGAGTMHHMCEAMAEDLDAGFVLFYSTVLQTDRIRTGMADQYARVCGETGRKPFLVLAPGPLTLEEMEVYRSHDIVVFGSSDVAFQTVRALGEAGLAAQENGEPLEPAYHLRSAEGVFLEREEVVEACRRVGIALPEERFIDEPGELPDACRSVGYPVVVKGLSSEATHKSDAGLVWLGVSGDREAADVSEQIKALMEDGVEINGLLVQEKVQGEVEVLIGVDRDPDLGFVLLLGSGGKYAEIADDVAACTVPSSRERIRDTLLSTRVGKILSGSRGNELSPDGVIEAAFGLQRLVTGNEHAVSAVDINPLVVSPRRAVAVDVRVVLRAPGEGGAPASATRVE